MWRIIARKMCSAATGAGKSVKPPIPVFGIEGRYVTALYSASVQSDQIDDVEEHLSDLLNILTKPHMVDFIETSMISRDEKADILMDAGEEAGMPSVAINFLAVVAENGRLKKLRRMLNMFMTVMVAHRNEGLCEVITAKPLDDATREELMKALSKFIPEGKNVQLTEKVDPSIIGGMIVGVEDKHIDMSIARKLQRYTDLIKQAV